MIQFVDACKVAISIIIIHIYVGKYNHGDVKEYMHSYKYRREATSGLWLHGGMEIP